MKSIYENAGFILAFLVGVLFLNAFAGEKFTKMTLLLILFSQVMLNPDIIETLQFKHLNQTNQKNMTNHANDKGVIFL